jgi:hypothetical protein
LALLIAIVAWAPVASAASTFDTVTVFATSPTAYELGQKPGVYTFTRTGSTGALTVTFAMSGTANYGSNLPNAGAPADYTLAGLNTGTGIGTIVIPDGATSVTLQLVPIVDALVEGGETADLTIQPDPSYIVGGSSVAEILIADANLTASVTVLKPVCYEPFSQPGQNPTIDERGAAIVQIALNQAFSNSSLGQLTFDLGGTAIPNTNYQVLLVVGGGVNVSARRALNGTSLVVGGWGATTAIFDANGSIVALSGNQLTLSDGTSRNGPGSFQPGDEISLLGEEFVLSTAAPSAGIANAYDCTLVPFYGSVLPSQIPKLTPIDTAVNLSKLSGNATRWQIPGLQGYSGINVEIAAAHDTTAEGATTVSIALEASPDFTLVDPTVGTVYVADTTNVLNIVLTSNAIEGSVNGVATVTSTGIFPFPINVPYFVTGTANYAANAPNPGQPAQYTMSGLDPTTGIGSITLPAGQLSAQIVLTPAVLGSDGVQQATISLADSLDYALAGTGSSSVNPSASINIADSGITIVVIPPVTTTGTAATTASGTTGTSSTGAPVRTLPTNSGSKSCGLGGGAALLGLGLAAFVRLRRRRA